MRKLVFKYFKITLTILLCYQLFVFIKRCIEYPPNGVGDFSYKLILSLFNVLPIDLIISATGGIILALIMKKSVLK